MTTYPQPLPFLQVLVNGEDRTPYVERGTLTVDRVLGSQVDQASFRLQQPETWRAPTLGSIKPTVGQEVIINVATLTVTHASERTARPSASDWRRVFGGTVQRVQEPRIAVKVVAWDIACVDFTEKLGRRLVQETYANWTVTDIVLDIIRRYAPQIRTTGVQTSARVIAGITFDFRYPRDCLDELSGLIGWAWYVDPDHVLYFYDPLSANFASALSLTDTSLNFEDLTIEPQLDQVRNRVYVQGGQAISDEITELWVYNGRDTNWQLQNRDLFLTPDPTEGGGVVTYSVKRNGVWRPAGVQGQADESTVEYLIDTVNGTVRLSADYALPDRLDVLEFVYKYRYPLSVVVEDTESQAMVAALAVQYDTIIAEADIAASPTPPVAYWKLNETGVPVTAADSSGNGHTGFYANFLASDTGFPGPVLGDETMTAVRMRGNASGQYIVVTHDGPLNLGGTAFPTFTPFAIVAWVRQDFANQSTAVMLLNKGDAVSVRMHWHGHGVVSLTSTTYGSLTTTTDLGLTVTNNCKIQLPDDRWHMVGFAFQWDFPALASVAGYLDGELVFEHTDGIVMNNAGILDDLYVGSRSTTQQILTGQLAAVALWNGVNVDAAAMARIYAAAQEDGVRETVLSAGDTQHAGEARALGLIELAKWSQVVTHVAWKSYVHGWELGSMVPISLTASGSGRTFSGQARVQRLTMNALGNQRIVWGVDCEASRFNLIDYYRQLQRQGQVIANLGTGTINKATAIDETYQAIALDGHCTTTDYGLLQYIAPDNLQGGSTPYAQVEYWILEQGVFS